MCTKTIFLDDFFWGFFACHRFLSVGGIIQKISIRHPDMGICIDSVEFREDFFMCKKIVAIDCNDDLIILAAMNSVVQVCKGASILIVLDEIYFNTWLVRTDYILNFLKCSISRAIIDVDHTKVFIMLR